MIDPPAVPRPTTAPTGLRAARPVWSVAALLNAVADALQARFAAVVVQGELSGFSRAPSGHCYFSLKDDRALEPALVRCAMFRRAAAMMDFQPRDGQLVEVRGRLAVYNARGDLQLVAEAMRPAGQGALYEQFLRLKARLEAEGLFDPAVKRPVPRHPQAVGVVTSLKAAALRDVLTALERRAPHLRVVVYPASVQGAEAPGELVRALRQADARAEVDTLILCRGGGSLEDLWAFNDEAVVRAIAACRLPVVVGVGHETDFTIADFVADLRAPTPTAAAELVAPQRDDCLDRLQALHDAMQRCVQRRLEREEQRLDHAALRLARPAQVLARMHREIDRLQQALAAAPGQRLQLARQRELHLADRLARSAGVQLQGQAGRLQALAARLQRASQLPQRAQAARLDLLAARLESANPERVLQRGYALLTDAQGQAVSRVAALGPGDTLHAVLADGRVRAQVLDTERRD
ncbi:exodeoxyribonuclease VII large subunit [Eleftheria terrae]|uniref:exodeoxyribonuclease VII large subunit n=1 Tax=Eleftheria terrae TaxID=1597781 RepID=UPI00263A766B|nr:exodeoxyribonuclease VII large subunit [Eleftheria terrae]WKB52846.1 exodeoxyribonuclease VII large subunit [Eleftheria terrae]